jgi:hypothetical protein
MSRKEPKPIAWEVIHLKATGRFLGVVYAADEDDAHATAIARFNIREPDKVHLLVRRVR